MDRDHSRSCGAWHNIWEGIWNETGEVELGISPWMVQGAANDVRSWCEVIRWNYTSWSDLASVYASLWTTILNYFEKFTILMIP